MTRQQAVKWLSNLKRDIGKTQHQELWHYEQALDEIMQALKQEQAWIPVSERLPEAVTKCLCTDISGVVVIDQYGFKAYGKIVKEWVRGGDYIAWKPLPEPYKVGDTE